jgi:hypothetical protein
MKNIIDIKLNYINPVTEELLDSINQIFTSIIENAKQLNVWDETIESIVITDNFNEEIVNQASSWNIKTEITKAKEYVVISKTLFNHNLESPKHKLFVQFSSLSNENISITEIVLTQIIRIKAKEIFPREILNIQFTPQPKTLKTFVTVSAIEWCKSYYSNRKIKNILQETSLPMNHNSFLMAFKRSMKRNLFEYNSDKLTPPERLEIFWKNHYDSLHNLFLRISENETEDEKIKINDDEVCKELLYDISCEIRNLTNNLIDEKKFEITELKNKLKKFSSMFEVHLEKESDENFRIRLTKNPKDYFKNILVDTEPRIICFLDILGFSDFINGYENDITSTFLQDIQESFSLAQEQLLDNKNIYNKEAIEHLEYQTFSDNICISIPYFDNENDFLSNLNILTIYIRGFQLIMMSKGFFTRGGISMGSFYADKNIIFSKGLVNAYYLESKKAIYPRTILDKKIVKKILNYDSNQIRYFGLNQAIILDWENQAFLNPLGLIDSSIQQLNSVFNSIDENDDDPTSKLLGSITKMTTDLLKTASTGEKENIELIKKYITENLYYYHDDEHIYSKYLWLQELFKWLENDGSEKLKFSFLTDILNGNE